MHNKIIRTNTRIQFANGWAHCVFVDTGKSIEVYELARSERLQAPPVPTRILAHDMSIESIVKALYPTQSIAQIIELSVSRIDDIKLDRLKILSRDKTDWGFASELYGIPKTAFPVINKLSDRSFENGVEAVYRSDIEKFLKGNAFSTIRDAAFRLGMTVENLKSITDRINSEIPCFINANMELGMIEAGYRQKLSNFFRISDVIGDLNELNDELHDAVRLNAGLEITKCYCFISKALGDEKPQYPYFYDALLFRPVSIKYSVAIKTNKSMGLSEDRISWYAHMLYEKDISEYEWVVPSITNEQRKKIMQSEAT